jgi:hypothetical protein
MLMTELTRSRLKAVLAFGRAVVTILLLPIFRPAGEKSATKNRKNTSLPQAITHIFKWLLRTSCS